MFVNAETRVLIVAVRTRKDLNIFIKYRQGIQGYDVSRFLKGIGIMLGCPLTQFVVKFLYP